MSINSYQGKFLTQAKAIILEHLSNENFGVSELAQQMHMSRSNLLRKIKKETRLSASQFIREVRLQKGMQLLKETDDTVSEISFKVGFSNNSYFTKCFREYYGYAPGEARAHDIEQDNGNALKERDVFYGTKPNMFYKYRYHLLAIGVTLMVMSGLAVYTFSKQSKVSVPYPLSRSIAVLPFKNMSGDSANVYFVNGLMESSLNNLQKIEDVRVISRTSVEKYRQTHKTAPEIAEELNVSYLLEGSGQRIDNQVLLNIQLIEAKSDTPVWAEQYNYKVDDIFALQNTIAKKIAEAIEAKVTPDELKRIEKQPTDNLVAYDLYLKGTDKFKLETEEGLQQAISLFQQAIEEDKEFALAYANIAMAYFYLDLNKKEKSYVKDLNNYADKALLYDSKSAESLISKALYYINTNEYKYAIPHLEKALEYNPNSSAVVQFLGDIYARIVPDTQKYLKYALKGIQLKASESDSIAKSYTYLHLSNALIQNGFSDQASKYIDLSLDFNPNNEYSSFLKIFIQYSKHRNINKTTNQLVREWNKDTSRLDILQEVGKFYYIQEKYDSAFYYYHKFDKMRVENKLDYYPHENLKIGIVFEKMGYKEKASALFSSFSDYCENDTSIYKSASLASWYAYRGEVEKAIEQLDIFATKDNFQYWIVLFLEKDPVMKALESHRDFASIMQKIKDRFWDKHGQIRQSLEDDGVLE